MEQRLLRYIHALSQAAERTRAHIRQLEGEGRQDEANLEKIRLNVLEQFAAQAGEDAARAAGTAEPRQTFCQLHTQRLLQKPGPWLQRLQKAAAHGDVVAQTIEETKLDALACIRAMFQETEGEP